MQHRAESFYPQLIEVYIMNTEIFDSFAVLPEKVFAQMQQYAELSMANCEKIFALQLEIAKSYSDLGVEQFKTFVEIKDAESLQAFVSKQSDVARVVGEKIISDVKAVTDLGIEINSDAKKLAQESISLVTTKAA